MEASNQVTEYRQNENSMWCLEGALYPTFSPRFSRRFVGTI